MYRKAAHRLQQLSARTARFTEQSRFSSALSTQSFPRRAYTLHIAASWAGKPVDAQTKQHAKPFASTSEIGAWRDQTLAANNSLGVADAGEDFFYIEQMRNGSGLAFGLADGVGGWNLNGFDPALFSQALMYHASRFSRESWVGEPEIDPTQELEEREHIEGRELTPLDCLRRSYPAVVKEESVEAGSSTACLLSFNNSSGLLRASNLGDSGFSIVRSSTLHHRQAVQTHFFNCPKQLTKMPSNPKIRKKFARTCMDMPEAADNYESNLRDGDIVVAYTDGFSDNVFPSEMVSISSLVARAGGTEDEQVRAMADRMVVYALQCMHNTKRPSPFQRDAARHGYHFRGGKEDDVTVIVGLVREN
ncbi:phosphatase 2C-like domain-containing protein [Pterulicium gracile]|uniref:Protein phosphatase n=1 Tax=Pterulicium gracile TaxID=1884261 RepID=A0A5C3QZX8_9AGAR|nr:phosphatase 2C-like domain-containing protein [Pterula gracilis]